MKAKVVSNKMPRMNGRSPDIGEVIDLDRKYMRAFVAAGFVVPFTPPAADIPASPSIPLTVETEAQETDVEDEKPVEEAPKDEKQETPAADIPASEGRKRRGYSRRDMKAGAE